MSTRCVKSSCLFHVRTPRVFLQIPLFPISNICTARVHSWRSWKESHSNILVPVWCSTAQYCCVVYCDCHGCLLLDGDACSFMLSATHCSTIQHTATPCNMLYNTASLQHVLFATQCYILIISLNLYHHSALLTTCSNTLQHNATHCNTLQHMLSATQCYIFVISLNLYYHSALLTTCSNTLQHNAIRCNTLQHTATHCHTPPHTATQCNSLQHSTSYCNTCPQLHAFYHQSATLPSCSNRLQRW